MLAKNRRKFFALGIYHGKTNRFIGKRVIVYGVKVLIRKMTRNRFYFKTTTHTYVLPIVSFQMILLIDTIEKPTLELKNNQRHIIRELLIEVQ